MKKKKNVKYENLLNETVEEKMKIAQVFKENFSKLESIKNQKT